MNKKYRIYLPAVMLLAIVTGTPFFTQCTPVNGADFFMQNALTHHTVAEISANPELINGKTVSGEIEDLHIKDKILTNTTFARASLRRPRFENVIFKDCVFIDTLIREAVFENVKFIGGKFARAAADDNYEVRSQFEKSRLKNVEFDSVAFRNFEFNGLGGDDGVLSFKNITDVSGYRVGVFAVGGKLLITIENCDIKGASFLVVHSKQKSRIYVANSTFTHSGVSGEALSFYAENSWFLNQSDTPDAETVVITNSIFSGALGASKNGYFVNNTYQNYSGCKGTPEANFYFVNKNRQKAKINMIVGNFYVYNMELVDSSTRQWNTDPPLSSLNLKDVTIRGGDWKKARVLGGQWENVQIYPPVDVTNANLGTIRVHNVTYPGGDPWVGRGSYAKIVPSETPFTWPEIHVPTKEELGMTEKMPEVTGKPSALVPAAPSGK